MHIFLDNCSAHNFKLLLLFTYLKLIFESYTHTPLKKNI